MRRFGGDAYADAERHSRATNGYTCSAECDTSAHRHAHTTDRNVTADRGTHANPAHRDTHTADRHAAAVDGHGVRGGL
jgi:hypothetical protein